MMIHSIIGKKSCVFEGGIIKLTHLEVKPISSRIFCIYKDDYDGYKRF